jgi:transporter family protein
VVLPIDKLSTVVSIAFAYIVFKEKLTRKSGLGLVMIVAGTLGMVIL